MIFFFTKDCTGSSGLRPCASFLQKRDLFLIYIVLKNMTFGLLLCHILTHMDATYFCSLNMMRDHVWAQNMWHTGLDHDHAIGFYLSLQLFFHINQFGIVTQVVRDSPTSKAHHVFFQDEISLFWQTSFTFPSSWIGPINCERKGFFLSWEGCFKIRKVGA